MRLWLTGARRSNVIIDISYFFKFIVLLLLLLLLLLRLRLRLRLRDEARAPPDWLYDLYI
jgi:hypothetical protein